MSDSSTLVITVRGRTNSGKTTMARDLSEFLRERGYAVSVVDDDITYKRDGSPEMQQARIGSLIERGTKVTIVTEHTGCKSKRT